MSILEAISRADHRPRARRVSPSSLPSDLRHVRLDPAADDGEVRVAILATLLAKEDAIQQCGDELYRLVEVAGDARLLLDFDRVQFVTSTLMGKLLRFQKMVRAAGGSLKLLNVRPVVRDVFRATRLERLFEFQDD